MKLLVLTISEFQDIELVAFASIMQASQKFSAIHYYSCEGKTSVKGQFGVANVDTITSYNVADYDALYVPGGQGAINLRKLPKGIECIKDFIAHDKYVISICDSPNAMAEHKVLKNEHSYVSWSDGTMNDPRRTTNLTIQTWQSGKFITGRCSLTTLELAFFTLEVLFGRAFSYQLRAALTGV